MFIVSVKLVFIKSSIPIYTRIQWLSCLQNAIADHINMAEW